MDKKSLQKEKRIKLFHTNRRVLMDFLDIATAITSTGMFFYDWSCHVHFTLQQFTTSSLHKNSMNGSFLYAAIECD